MNYTEPELKEALIRFDKLLRTCPDRNENVLAYKQFITSFLRVKTKNLTLPTSEIMSVIQHERPSTFYLLKKSMSYDPTFELLTNIDLNYEMASLHLSAIKEHLS
ncbi:hypothetical protein [Jeotgalibacillus aurantiacus]|uniref:hypothetical protein n=1 Tax=Jeotgalibacillus aurantiacus TaxID=2763266 RepID=UPI001D0A692A|nr:hypothetical protein [Jeotgalibacillus aurantiacus]